MDPYLIYFKPLKATKTFDHTEILNNKIHRNLHYPGCPCQNQDKSIFIKPEAFKLYRVRYEFQYDKGGTRNKVLPTRCKKMIFRSICLYF